MKKLLICLLAAGSFVSFAQQANFCGKVSSIEIKTVRNSGTKNVSFMNAYIERSLVADLNSSELVLLSTAKANNLEVCASLYIDNSFDRKIVIK